MIYLRHFVLGITSFITLGVLGQNLVPNGDFETYSSCPTGLVQVDRATPWVRPTAATSDFYHTGGGECNFTEPGEVACSGNGFMGLFTYINPTAGWPDYREYIGVRLTQALEAGKMYCISFMTKRFPSRGTYYSDKIGVHLSPTPVQVNNRKFLPLTPHYETPAGILIKSDNECTTIEGTFCADGGEQYLIIGNFNNDANTTVQWDGRPPQFKTQGTVWPGAYYQIDNVILEECIPEVVVTDNTTCVGECVTVSASASGGTPPYRYSWNGGAYSGDNTFQACPQTVNDTTFIVTVIDSNGCTIDIDTSYVQAETCSEVIIESQDVTICPGECINISATVTQGTEPFNIVWSTGDIGEGPHQVCPGATETYTVVVTDADGAKDSTTATVTVAEGVTTTIESTNVSCNGAGDGMGSITTNSGQPPFLHEWNDDNTTTGSKATDLGPGTYEVITTDDLGCMDTNSVVISEPPPIVLEIIATPPNCNGEGGSAKVNASGGTGPYSYVWNTDPVSSDDSIGDLTEGVYVVSVTDDHRCIAVDSADIAIVPEPASARFDYNPKVTDTDNPIVSFTDRSTDANSWIWSFGDGDSSSVQHPEHSFQVAGTYNITLTVTNESGCPSVASGVVVVNPVSSFYVPNVFTPNGDGDNDSFIGQGIGIIEHYMWIYDRWGVLIYSTNTDGSDDVVPWNGRINNNGAEAQEDTYVYVVKTVNVFKETNKYIGHVSLVR